MVGVIFFVRIGYFSLSYMIVQWISSSFGLLVGQNKLFEDVTLNPPFELIVQEISTIRNSTFINGTLTKNAALIDLSHWKPTAVMRTYSNTKMETVSKNEKLKNYYFNYK